jgi:hypothetical protein
MAYVAEMELFKVRGRSLALAEGIPTPVAPDETKREAKLQPQVPAVVRNVEDPDLEKEIFSAVNVPMPLKGKEWMQFLQDIEDEVVVEQVLKKAEDEEETIEALLSLKPIIKKKSESVKEETQKLKKNMEQLTLVKRVKREAKGNEPEYSSLLDQNRAVKKVDGQTKTPLDVPVKWEVPKVMGVEKMNSPVKEEPEKQTKSQKRNAARKLKKQNGDGTKEKVENTGSVVPETVLRKLEDPVISGKVLTLTQDSQKSAGANPLGRRDHPVSPMIGRRSLVHFPKLPSTMSHQEMQHAKQLLSNIISQHPQERYGNHLLSTLLSSLELKDSANSIQK